MFLIILLTGMIIGIIVSIFSHFRQTFPLDNVSLVLFKVKLHGNKKAGRTVLIHLATGIAKHHKRKRITTFHPRCICSSNTARAVCIHTH